MSFVKFSYQQLKQNDLMQDQKNNKIIFNNLDEEQGANSLQPPEKSLQKRVNPSILKITSRGKSSSLPNNTLTVDKTEDKNVNNKMKNEDCAVANNQSDEEDFKSLEKMIRNLQNISSSLVTSRGEANDDVITKTKNKRVTVNSARDDETTRDSSVVEVEGEKLLVPDDNDSKNVEWSQNTTPVSSPQTPVQKKPFQYTISSKSKFFKRAVKFPKRAVLKNGECNVMHSAISNSRMRYLQDIFTTLVDTQWRWTLLVFALGFMLSWLFYAVIWWLICYTHGDFDHIGDDNWTPCVEAVHGFATCFLFSVETQHTIGYGGRATNDECPEAIFVMCMQSITGVMISAFMAGIFFAKMARPRQRSQTLLFSRRAVICLRDGQLSLMFRVGDMRKSHIIGVSIRAHMFRTRMTREGEELPQYQCELPVTVDGCESNMFFIWPLTVVHAINKESPLYNISAHELLRENFEIVAILEGTVESTGQTTQARTSYLPAEIKWGHRFESLITYNDNRQGYQIDYKKFNNSVRVATPLCSAKDLDEIFSVQNELFEYSPN